MNLSGVRQHSWNIGGNAGTYFDGARDRGAQKLRRLIDYWRQLQGFSLRVLLTMAKRTSRSGKTILLAGPTPEVVDIFQIANFTAIFKIAPTVDEAVAIVMVQG